MGGPNPGAVDRLVVPEIFVEGECPSICTTDDFYQVFNGADYAKIANSADFVRICNEGSEVMIGSSGVNPVILGSGCAQRISSSGAYAEITSEGENAVIVCAGHNSKVRAKTGSWITLSEWSYDPDVGCSVPVCVKTVQVDGKEIKADTFYTLRDGKFIEVH